MNEGLDVIQSVLHFHLCLHLQKIIMRHFPFKSLYLLLSTEMDNGSFLKILPLEASRYIRWRKTLKVSVIVFALRLVSFGY
jgi:hypothetical protein